MRAMNTGRRLDGDEVLHLDLRERRGHAAELGCVFELQGAAEGVLVALNPDAVVRDEGLRRGEAREDARPKALICWLAVLVPDARRLGELLDADPEVTRGPVVETPAVTQAPAI